MVTQETAPLTQSTPPYANVAGSTAVSTGQAPAPLTAHAAYGIPETTLLSPPHHLPRHAIARSLELMGDPTAPFVIHAGARYRFPGFSLTMLPDDRTEKTFLAEVETLAHAPGTPGMWKHISNELRSKGLAHEADLMDGHLARYGHEPFYHAMDNWLAALAKRSPETVMHIDRQSVAMALTAREMLHDLPAPEFDAQMVRALIAATAHDIGKLSLNPELLHKPYRIPAKKFEALLAAYEQNVPDYAKKAEHLEFLRMINGGRIPFDTSSVNHQLGVSNIIARVNAEPLLGEAEFADPALKGSSRTVYETIKHKMLKYHVPFDDELEHALLNDGRRGTLSAKEAHVIAIHDALGMQMLDMVGLPPELHLHPAIADLEKEGTDMLSRERPDLLPLHHMIHLTDILEALTGQRAYNRENGKNLTTDEAMLVLQNVAQHGHIDPQLVADVKAGPVVHEYDRLYVDIPKDRHHPQPVIVAHGAVLDSTVTPRHGRQQG